MIVIIIKQTALIALKIMTQRLIILPLTRLAMRKVKTVLGDYCSQTCVIYNIEKTRRQIIAKVIMILHPRIKLTQITLTVQKLLEMKLLTAVIIHNQIKIKLMVMILTIKQINAVTAHTRTAALKIQPAHNIIALTIKLPTMIIAASKIGIMKLRSIFWWKSFMNTVMNAKIIKALSWFSFKMNAWIHVLQATTLRVSRTKTMKISACASLVLQDVCHAAKMEPATNAMPQAII